MTAHQFEPLLRKAIADLDRPDQAARDAVYEHVRQTLVRQLQESGHSDTEIDQELESFLAAVARIEREAARRPDHAAPPSQLGARRIAPDPSPILPSEPKRFPVTAVAIAGVVVAALAAASVVYLMSPRGSTPVAQPPRAQPSAPKVVAAAPAPPATAERPTAAAPSASTTPATAAKAPSEDTAAFWLRRQRVFYRTTHPPGTIVVSLNQRFLYLVQPNQVAIRYAIGVGPACNNASGLFRITEKIARSTPPGTQAKNEWFDPPALYFDKGRAVHEATEPGRIGQSANAGCFQSWDQDIADLFERIAVNERVVIAN